MNSIPQELRDLTQWVTFTVGPETDPKTGKPVKTPFIPGTTVHASPVKPEHWRTFEEAAEHGHPAFVLTENDPYVFIDFDELQLRKGETAESLASRQEAAYDVWGGIENTFVSYMERSVSGKGVHILGRGSLVGQGSQRKDYGLELYDRGRFVIFTGDPLLDAPVSEFPAEDLLRLERWMRKESGGDVVEDDPHSQERPQTLTDEEVCLKACTLDRVPALFRGEYESLGIYPSQSEADFDLIAELFRASRNTEQVKRIFQQTPLYRPEKVWDYVERCTLRVKQERLVVEKEMARLTKSLNGTPTKKLKIVKPAKATEPIIPDEAVGTYLEEAPDTFKKLVEDLPSGLLRDVTDAFYHFAHLPLFEGALAGALNTAHCIFSRSFQTSTGLALKGWLILVGPTSCGKEIATKGPQSLLRATGIPSVAQIIRGEPRSEQGLFRMISETPRMLIHIDECAAWVRSLCDPRAPACPAQLREALTKLFSKGDEDGVFYSTERSQKSDTTFVERPCVSIFGDSQDGNIYANLTSEQIATGFLPRFLFMDVDYAGIAAESQQAEPLPKLLIEQVREAMKFTGLSEIPAQGRPPLRVPVDPKAAAKLKDYETMIRRRLFKEEQHTDGDIFKMLHSRSAAKVGIYMALLAVCADWHSPYVTLEHFEWAKRFVELCTGNMISNLTEGQFAADTKEQRRAVETALSRAMSMSEDARSHSQYFTSETLIQTAHAVPLSWLRNAVCRLRCFRDDRRDLGMSLGSVLKELEEDGLYTVINKESAFQSFRARCPVICQLTEDYWQGKDEEEPQF